MKKHSILDEEATLALPEETLNEMFRKLNTLNKDSIEYKNLVDEIAMHNLRLVPLFGKNYLKTIEMDDLIQIGAPGVLKAVMAFDINSNVPFASYAKYWINTELKRNAYMENSQIHLSKREYEALCKYYALCSKFEIEKGREPEFEDIYPLMDLSPKQTRNLASILEINIQSILDNTIDEDNSTTLLDRVASFDANPFSGSSIVKNLLTDIEYDILMAKGEGLTNKQIATYFNLEVEDVKDIISDVLEKVKNSDIYDALKNNTKE